MDKLSITKNWSTPLTNRRVNELPMANEGVILFVFDVSCLLATSSFDISEVRSQLKIELVLCIIRMKSLSEESSPIQYNTSFPPTQRNSILRKTHFFINRKITICGKYPVDIQHLDLENISMIFRGGLGQEVNASTTSNLLSDTSMPRLMAIPRLFRNVATARF
jgi:hypothetical protein